MKHAKKLASLLLALVMVFALATTAFAADSGSITVDNPITGQTYTAFKIFDVVYNDGKTAYSYTIDSNSEWFETVQTYANATPSKGLTLTQVNGSNTYNVTTTNAFSAPDFAKALKQAVSGKNGTALTAQGNTVTVSNLTLGYYFVTSTNGALCNLTTTNPSVTIHDKNDMPFDKTDNNTTSVEVGQTVNYTITGKVPDYTGFKTYTYLITDTMSEGLTFKKDVTVTVGGTDVTTACTVTNNVGGDANKFTVSIPVLDNKYTIGAPIVVTYSAVVNEKAVAKISTNHAVLKYSNNPTNDQDFKETPADEETVYSAKIVIDKYETNKKNTKLSGAKFVLLNSTKDKYYKYTPAVTDDPNATEVDETAPEKVEWVSTIDNATVVITDNGHAEFNGLKDGTYYLMETEAPAGYNMLEAPVPVTVNGANTTEANLSALTVTQEVANNTGALLPSTGGMGTTIFYVLGSILVVGAIVLLVTKKRMNAVDR